MKKTVAVVLIMALNIISCASTQTSTQGLHPLEYMNDSKMFLVDREGEKDECWEVTKTNQWEFDCNVPYSIKVKIEILNADSTDFADYTKEELTLLARLQRAKD